MLYSPVQEHWVYFRVHNFQPPLLVSISSRNPGAFMFAYSVLVHGQRFADNTISSLWNTCTATRAAVSEWMRSLKIIRADLFADNLVFCMVE
jgi:hypothetical protein